MFCCKQFISVWTEAALKRGDKVAATARKLISIADFKEKYGETVLTLELDVTIPEQVTAAIEQAYEHFGRLDIVLNNAGYSLVGTIEEGTSEEVKAMRPTSSVRYQLLKRHCRCCANKAMVTYWAHLAILGM